MSKSRLNQIFLVSLLMLLFLANNVFCNGIKKRFGVGWQCLPAMSYNYYSDYYYYSPYWVIEQIEFMARINNSSGIIFSVSKRPSLAVLQVGVQSYFTPEKKVSPYLKLDLDMFFYDYDVGNRKSINAGLGFHYFHNEHIGVALHSSIFKYFFYDNGSHGDIYMSPGLYIWLFL